MLGGLIAYQADDQDVDLVGGTAESREGGNGVEASICAFEDPTLVPQRAAESSCRINSEVPMILQVCKYPGFGSLL